MLETHPLKQAGVALRFKLRKVNKLIGDTPLLRSATD
jgi:hypothetical protein